ncbi:hypothetical protein LSH36_193g12039 [Paralvinella palmiformis]|uniref:Uncharacterized protein n=1 Tax=Paralvinella palmiformis TaxID=53620 RepID=A0AAD9JR39_9ANNE|nr:hypothetical protein LSH36_193g12039 [Paralvinella palmiformis]
MPFIQVYGKPVKKAPFSTASSADDKYVASTDGRDRVTNIIDRIREKVTEKSSHSGSLIIDKRKQRNKNEKIKVFHHKTFILLQESAFFRRKSTRCEANLPFCGSTPDWLKSNQNRNNLVIGIIAVLSLVEK